MRPILLVAATLSFGCLLAQAQSSAPTEQRSTSKPSEPPKPDLHDIKPEPPSGTGAQRLKDLAPLSPEEAARMTARSLARHDHAGGPVAKGDKNDRRETQPADESKMAGSDAVMEFRPAGSGSGTDSAGAVVSDGKQSKSPLKRVHGELYGAGNGAGHAGGGSVGATSKSGKTSVYVESDQAHSAVPQPH